MNTSKRWASLLTFGLILITLSLNIFKYSPEYVLRKDPASTMALREQALKKACRKWNSTINRNLKSYIMRTERREFTLENIRKRPLLFVYKPERLGWCKVLKDASTSMIHVFGSLFGMGEPTSSNWLTYLKRVKLKLKPEIKDWNSDLRNAFLIARHPFERVLSVYRNKFRDSDEYVTISKLYGKTIIKNYRKEPPEDKGYISVPTFKEFVEYLIDTPIWKYNNHWLPIYMTCAPCHNHFNLILHTETIGADIEYVVGVTGIEGLQPHRVHSTNLSSDEKKSTNPRNHQKEIEQMHFATLNRNHLEGLFKIYQIDFEMFQYSLYPYDEYVKND